MDLLKDSIEDRIDDLKGRAYFVIRKTYFYLTVSFISVLLLCFSIGGLIIKIADRLDSIHPFFWSNSMTLYTCLAGISGYVLYWIANRDNDRYQPSLDQEIEALIKARTKRKRRKNANAKRSRY